MAFTLISVRHLDDANCTVLFKDGICMIKNPAGHVMAMFTHSNGPYQILLINFHPKLEYAAIATPKMDINVAPRKFGHVVHVAIKHTVSKGFILGIDLDMNSKPKFCKACAKAKSTMVPFLKESLTRATKYSERVHWDLWRPASVKILRGNYYVAACIDDVTHETKLYFQKKKSDMVKSYLRDKAYIETQTGNCIKVVYPN